MSWGILPLIFDMHVDIDIDTWVVSVMMGYFRIFKT